jgi:hypothetical protein
MQKKLNQLKFAEPLDARARKAVTGGIITRYICAYDCVIYSSLTACRANCPFGSCFRGTICP